jgi:hypothetical protein
MGNDLIPRRPHATRQVQAVRLAELIIFLTEANRYRHEWVKFCRDRWGISSRHSSTLFSRALATIREQNTITRDQQAKDALGRIDARIARGMKDRDYIRAEELRANIVGYLAPKQVEVAQVHITAAAQAKQLPVEQIRQIACAMQGVALPAVDVGDPLAITDVASSVQNAATPAIDPAVQSPAPMVVRDIVQAGDVPPAV